VDEFSVALEARRLSKQVREDQIPIPLELYLEAIKSQAGEVLLRYDTTLANDEAGLTFKVAGKTCIVINQNDAAERQRFTACHEIAHIVLELPTDHDGPKSHFVRRSQTETLCDMFASELLLPAHLLRPRVQDEEITFGAVESLAHEFIASLAATGSSFAAVCDRPCAFVLAQAGVIRYASRSKSLRELGGWIRPGTRVPTASAGSQLLRSKRVAGPIEIDCVQWLDDWARGGVLLEDARHFPRWDQTLSLLWFEEDQASSSASARHDDDDVEPVLRPLDGFLPWPGRSRRRP
jgi:Zn-dependent peptidase ImmA (M78 family)